MFFDLEQDERTAVKTAVTLAVSRYRDTIGKFVQNKPDRLTIVSDQVHRIACECAEAAKADEDEVTRLFDAYLAELAVSEPEKQNVTDTAEYNNSDEVPQPKQKDKGGVRDDIKGTDAVLDDDPAEHLDMNDESSLTESESEVKVTKTANPQQTACPYCGHMMTPIQNATNPAASGQQQKCPNCGATVMAAPGQDQPGMAQQQGMPGFQQGMPTGIGGGMYAKCARCEKESAEEASIFCEACNEFVRTGQGQLEDPDSPEEENVKSPAESDPQGDPQQSLPPAAREDSNGPAQVYTGIVEQTANSNAAMAWSTPGDDDVQQIAQQYGIDPDAVRKHLRIVADFGDALAVNGDPNADPNVDGMTLLDGFGGQIPTTEEEVDVDNAIQHTADRTNLSPDDVYALIKESYGGDIGGQHYVSVSGEAHYYLPDSLVPQQPQEPQPQPDQATPGPQQPMPSVPAHLRTIAAFLDWEKAELAHSDA
jgi:hypothetical protein